ncbi:MAG TPA: hypothetical protein VMT56_01610 [Candidatus Bathyarchaeia archaeon]|nr:hypothetical protein [Candidatus Bathyarchaeia archaeon]
MTRQTAAQRYILVRVVQVRRLVAVELTFLGSTFILAEYAVAVLVSLTVSILSLRSALIHTNAGWQVLLGAYLLFLAVTYAVLLATAIGIARRGDCRQEIADELHDPRRVMRKYRRQSLWILVPLVVPIAFMRQSRPSAP